MEAMDPDWTNTQYYITAEIKPDGAIEIIGAENVPSLDRQRDHVNFPAPREPAEKAVWKAGDQAAPAGAGGVADGGPQAHRQFTIAEHDEGQSAPTLMQRLLSCHRRVKSDVDAWSRCVVGSALVDQVSPVPTLGAGTGTVLVIGETERGEFTPTQIMLTPADVERGYQCDACADQAERGY